jgi:adenylate cyclase
VSKSAKEKDKSRKKQDESHRKEGMRGHRSRVLLIGFGLTFFIALLSLAGVFAVPELKSIDWRFDWRGPRPLSVPAAIVAIDDESLNGWSDADGNAGYMPERWVWPRDFHARLIKNLKEAGAKVVAFDIVFSESSKRGDGPKQDKAFGDAAKAAGNVIFAERHVIKEGGALKTETLIHVLELAKRDKGHIMAAPGTDNFLRSLRPLYFNSSGAPDPDKPSLDIAVLRQYLHGKATPVSYDSATHQVRMGDVSIPLKSDFTTDINFAGEPGTVPTFSYHDVYNKTMDMGFFKDKIVYVGSTSDILHDNHRTPFAATGRLMPGVEAHVHFLDTLLTGQYLTLFPQWVDLALILVLGVMTSFLTFRASALMGGIVASVIAVTYGVAAIYVFQLQNVVLPMVAPLTAVAVAFSGLAVYRGFLEENRARKTRQMFSKYVSKTIVDEILRNPDAVKLGGEVKEVTILFSDVRGFTAMSERLSAPEVVEVLNEYLTAMVDIVIANDGTLDKYVGDAIMAVWGSPVADPEHKKKALLTAVQMMEVLQELKAKWKAEGKPEMDIGIGLNTGHVVAGNMGHPDFKMDYTVIGDDVNLAARMESANKEMRSHVLITGASYEGCEDMVDVIMHPPIHVKGKVKDIDVIEVIGWKNQGRAPWAAPLPG